METGNTNSPSGRGREGEGLLYSHLKVAAVPLLSPAPRLQASLALSPSKQSNQRHRRWRQIRMPATWPGPGPPLLPAPASALTAASRGVLCGRGSSNSSSTVNTSHAERIPKTLPTPFQPTQQQPAPPTDPCYAPKPRSHDGRRLGTLPSFLQLCLWLQFQAWSRPGACAAIEAIKGHKFMQIIFTPF